MTLEVYPYSIYRVLVGSRTPTKRSALGAAARVAALTAAGVSETHLAMWSHDALDAAAASVVALQWHQRRAQKVTCGHDKSAIWLPASQLIGPDRK